MKPLTEDQRRLVESVAKMVRRAAYQKAARVPAAYRFLEDLIQEGWAGAIEAVRLYDPSRGVKFSTFAHPWIHNKVSTQTRLLLNPASGFGKYLARGELPEEDSWESKDPWPDRQVEAKRAVVRVRAWLVNQRSRRRSNNAPKDPERDVDLFLARDVVGEWKDVGPYETVRVEDYYGMTTTRMSQIAAQIRPAWERIRDEVRKEAA